MENSFEEERRIEKARKKVKDIMGFYKHLASYILVNGLLLIISAVNMKPDENFFTFNTFFTAGVWGIGLLAHAASVFGRNIFFNQAWEDRKIQEFMEKEKNSTSKWE
jgi:hypothetical protein